MPAQSEITQVLSRLTDPDIAAIDAWRRAQQVPPSRNRAVELLVRQALLAYNWNTAAKEAVQHAQR
jgi:hypothetical protein